MSRSAVVVSVYRRLNHHGSLISECSNDVQREHGASGIQESERRLHRDENARPSNPGAGGRQSERERESERWKTPPGWMYSGGRRWCSATPTTFDVKSVHYLQCTISGSSPLLRSLMEVVNSRKSEGSSGTPWSGHATYCRCVTARSSPFWAANTHISSQGTVLPNVCLSSN